MLFSCPECGLQVSDKAAHCPHCGYPIKQEPKYVIGHVIEDLTESVYTKRDISWLKEEIEKIK